MANKTPILLEKPILAQDNKSEDLTAPELMPKTQATGVYVTVHGHFYQPPRENPYLDAIERQPGAAPCHDWNEKILFECYRPNAFSRILNDRGEVVSITNNFAYLSFNIGPTLMSWLERYHQDVYQKILEGDKLSYQRLGKGNAIAQVYNHIIMPLANERDRYTQIRWGKEDFRSRFGHDPEGMWLAEAAVDYATLEALVDEGINFIVLAPSQAKSCRPFPSEANPHPEWQDVSNSEIDSTCAYRCYLKGDRTATTENGENAGKRNYIDIFFYDGPISGDMGFSDALNSSQNLAGRLRQAVRTDGRPSQLIAVATDGETFGHHKGGTEKCLAYAFTQEFEQQGWKVTNFAHYLSMNPPTWEVELKPVTAWSCSHGVDRWQEDCGCGGGGLWHQKWRRPLRDTLNWLRDRLIPIYNEIGSRLFRDPWEARDDYIQVIRGREIGGEKAITSINEFLAKHQIGELSQDEKVDALRLLEMQRQSLLMFTSCGWFFDEISRPEGTQILRYAARAIELAGEVAGVQLETEFISKLEQAPSNVDLFRNGAIVYRQLVMTAQVTLEQVAAHYAINSLFANYQKQDKVYCYRFQQIDYQMQRMGALTLAVGQVIMVSEITLETRHLVFAVLHLGGWDFHCCLRSFNGRKSYAEMKQKLLGILQEGSAAHAIVTMVQFFGEQSYSLKDLFAEERHRLMSLLSQETLTRLDQLYTQVYRDNYGVMMAFHRDELPIASELQVAAEVALSHRFLTAIQKLDQESMARNSSSVINELEAISAEAKNLRCRLNVPSAKGIIELVVKKYLRNMIENYDLIAEANTAIENGLERIERLISLGYELNLGLALYQTQELYFDYLHGQIIPRSQEWQPHDYITPTTYTQMRRFLKLGQTLAIDISI